MLRIAVNQWKSSALSLRDMLSCQGPAHSFIISLIYLKPASLLIKHHSSMPSWGFVKFTWLGLLRGCLRSSAFLIRFLVLWFLEWILIKFLQNSSGCFHLPHGKCLVWWLPITFIHVIYPLLSSTLLWVVHPQLIMLKMPYANIYWVFLCFALGFIRLCATYWEKQSFHDWFFPLTKVSGISLKYPPPFFHFSFWKR